ncbi:MAG: hypothetical protein U9P14_02540 [Gemmatimonadota bacterium]|nr:hypothetical protein [Gemmatimonadota bacterium]
MRKIPLKTKPEMTRQKFLPFPFPLMLPALLIILVAAFGWITTLQAKTFFSGSSRSLFLYRENYTGQGYGNSEHNLRFFKSVRMKLVGRGKKNSLGFHTFFRVSRDLNIDYEDDPLSSLYNCYLEWKRGRLSAALGRQWLHLGSGSLTLDGVRVGYAGPGSLDLTGYLGTESPYTRHFNLQGWDRAKAGGVYLNAKVHRRIKVGAGFQQKERLGVTAMRETGLDARARLPGRVRLSGRLDLNLLTDRIQRGVFRVSRRGQGKWNFYSEYKHYEPRLFYQSYFRRFNPRSNDQVRAGATYYLRPEFTLTGSYSAIFFQDENNCYLSLGLGCPYGSATLYRGDGYGGDEFGFAAGVTYPLCEKLELFADIDYSRYRLYEDEDRDCLFSSIFGFNWRPRKNVLAGVELQDLNNNVLSSDWRLLVNFSVNHRKIF